MSDFGTLGRLLIFVGAVILMLGAGLAWIGRAPGLGWLGRLPGDIFIQRKNFSFYFPVTTGLIISVFLSVILWLLARR